MLKVMVNEDARQRISKTKLSTLFLSPGKEYEVMAVEPFIDGNWYRIIDEEGEDYLYPPSLFDIVEE